MSEYIIYDCIELFLCFAMCVLVVCLLVRIIMDLAKGCEHRLPCGKCEKDGMECKYAKTRTKQE